MEKLCEKKQEAVIKKKRKRRKGQEKEEKSRKSCKSSKRNSLKLSKLPTTKQEADSKESLRTSSGSSTDCHKPERKIQRLDSYAEG